MRAVRREIIFFWKFRWKIALKLVSFSKCCLVRRKIRRKGGEGHQTLLQISWHLQTYLVLVLYYQENKGLELKHLCRYRNHNVLLFSISTAGHLKSLGGPLVARGPQVGHPWSMRTINFPELILFITGQLRPTGKRTDKICRKKLYFTAI